MVVSDHSLIYTIVMDTILKEIRQLTDNLVSEILRLIPNLILALVVLFLGILFARICRKLIRQFILYLHRWLNDKLKTNRLAVDLQSSAKFVAIAVFWIIILFTVALITQILELSFLTKWFDGLILYLPNVLAALVIIFSGYIIGKLVSDLISSVFARIGLPNGPYLGGFTKYIILVISIIIAIDQVGIDIAFLTNLVLIVLGILLFGGAFAFSLGARSVVSNIISSYYVRKTYQIGETIHIGDVEGVITKITETSVFLETESGKTIIPTSVFSKEKTIIKNNT